MTAIGMTAGFMNTTKASGNKGKVQEVDKKAFRRSCLGCLAIPAFLILIRVLVWIFGRERMDRLFEPIERLIEVFILVPLLFLAVAMVAAVVIILEGRKGGPAPLRIAGALLIVYGATGFLLPASASWVLPHKMEWPLEREVRTLALENGAYAVEANGGRVQIYDRDGNYLTGWFVPSFGRSFDMHYVPGTGVGVRAGSEILLYDLDGNVLSREKVSYLDTSRDFQNGPFEKRRVDTPWWLLPLAWPPYGFLAGAIGVALAGLSPALVWRRPAEEK